MNRGLNSDSRTSASTLFRSNGIIWIASLLGSSRRRPSRSPWHQRPMKKYLAANPSSARSGSINVSGLMLRILDMLSPNLSAAESLRYKQNRPEAVAPREVAPAVLTRRLYPSGNIWVGSRDHAIIVHSPLAYVKFSVVRMSSRVLRGRSHPRNIHADAFLLRRILLLDFLRDRLGVQPRSRDILARQGPVADDG